MSDLISRSELLKRLEEWNTSDKTDKALYNFALHRIIEQPTAYDVGKIVEELESFAELAEDRWTNGTSKHAYQEHKCWVKAIEIVKQGGVTDDVCEWKYTKEIMDNAEFKVGCNPNALKRGVVPNNFSYHDFKYCPYCGKKIKVVE